VDYSPKERINLIYLISQKRLGVYIISFYRNQADNFKSYWKPLLDNKPSNCVIWGAREKMYLLLLKQVICFPSKGDKDNKELNPIALKEALEFKVPMLMYNLDVYCGKYDSYNNIKFSNR
jgi:hypothetical protein